MAKPRRRVSRRSSARADWVYRPYGQTLGTGGAGATDLLGTYGSFINVQTTGLANAQSHILYDSADYFGLLNRGGVGSGATVATVNVMGREARAEGRKACIRAVEGIVYIEPNTWSLGVLIAQGMRIGVFEQDRSGVFSLDAAYSMWVENPVIPLDRTAHWANNPRNNAWERRIHYPFGDASTIPLYVAKVRWRGRKYLHANECFGLYTELESTSVTVRQQFWLRSFVEDEG